MAPLYFIFAQKFFDNRDNRPQSTCVGLDNLGFFSYFRYFRSFESYENIRNTVSHRDLSS